MVATKLVKPTPAQAILLRELNTERAYIRSQGNRYKKIAYARGYYLRSNNVKVLYASTVRTLVERGWVVSTENPGVIRSDFDRLKIAPAGVEILSTLTEEDFCPKRPTMTAAEICDYLRDRYQLDEWVLFFELRAGTGYAYKVDQRVDAWVMNTWPSKDLIKLAFEIKISRNDFLRELKHPEKREYAMSISNRFYFLTPQGLVSPEEVPADCGLIEVALDGQFKTVREAPLRKIEQPEWLFIASLARQICHQHERMSKQE